MNLGTWIDTLEALPAKATVEFDDGTTPTELISWRGIYAELSLDSDGQAGPITVAKLLKNAKAAEGKTFTGYKGGDFTMSRHTPVWADPYSEYNSRGLMGAALNGDKVILITADLSDYR